MAARKEKHLLTPKQVKAVALLLEGLPPWQVAKQIGITTPCMSNWQAKSAFIAALAKGKNDILDTIVVRIARVGLKALAVLENGLGSVDENVQMRAASTILAKLVDISIAKKLYDQGREFIATPPPPPVVNIIPFSRARVANGESPIPSQQTVAG